MSERKPTIDFWATIAVLAAFVWYAELGTKRYKKPLLDDPAIPAIEQ